MEADAAVRSGLAVGDLFALADGLLAGDPTDADTALLAAFDAADLATVSITATTFIVAHAATYRGVAAVLRRPTYAAGTARAIRHAAALVSSTVAILRDRLAVLPDAGELERLGELIARGDVLPADLAVVRAPPGPYLRARSAAEHWRVFVDYRLHDD